MADKWLGGPGVSTTPEEMVFQFSGHKTALWNPVIQTGDPRFGLRATGCFGLPIAGTANVPIVVEACATCNLFWFDDAGSAKVFRCVYHAWSYDLQGNLVSIAFENVSATITSVAQPMEPPRMMM